MYLKALENMCALDVVQHLSKNNFYSETIQGETIDYRYALITAAREENLFLSSDLREENTTDRNFRDRNFRELSTPKMRVLRKKFSRIK